MIEVSAAAAPMTARTGVVLAAVSAEQGADAAATPDFSAVLAGAAAVPAPNANTPLTVVTPGFGAIQPGNTGNAGNATGKTLPPGKDEAADDEPSEAPPVMALLLPGAMPPPAAAQAPAVQVLAQSPATGDQPETGAPALPELAPSGDKPAPASPADHKAAQSTPAAPVDLPAAPRLDAPSLAVPNDLRPAPAQPAFAAAASPQAQDIGALVDRIAEARAAAAPEGIRAALMHEDFGAVSLRFRADESHIQVTLGSNDPGFAPAVHAAAAASLADDKAGQGDRRDAPRPQAQDTATQNQQAQQQAQQQSTRERTAERAPARHAAPDRTGPAASSDETPSTPLRRSGIYA